MAQTWQPNAGDDYYDIPQILKRLDWLDAERRKDKDAIYLLQEQITQLKSENLALKNDIKDLQKEISVYPSVFPRLDHLEGTIAQNRGELQIMIEENNKAHTLKEAELEGNQRTVQESLSRAILELRKQVEPIGDIKKAVGKYDVAISEIGEVNNSGEPILIKEDGSNEKLVPLFREAAYTKIKKLVGDTTPEDFEEMKEKVQKASDAAIAKKDKVIDYIRGN